MGTVNINGVTHNGNSIIVNNGKVIIDGKEVDQSNSKTINIQVQGDIKTLKVDACNAISVNGEVGFLKTTSGDIEIDGDVNGSVSTVSGDVECRDVRGDVKTVSGDISRIFR